MNNAMLIDPADDVVVAIESIGKGETVEYVCNGEAVQFPALEDITIYHKVARRDISTGAPVIKYGQHIGIAACDIRKGEHVHIHNVTSHRENLDG
jgi:altronate dehydratase small subunit